MAVTAVTPRVRSIVVCDEVFASATEAGVFTLEGVRQHLMASSLPTQASPSVFILLSSARRGTFPGRLLLVNDRDDKAIRHITFAATFDKDNDLLPVYVEVGLCVFPDAGKYRFEVYFSDRTGAEALKGEQPFFIIPQEE